MTAIFRALVILATAGSLSTPAESPRKAVGISNPNPATRPEYKTTDLEFYLTEDGIAYIRPGLNVKRSFDGVSLRVPRLDVVVRRRRGAAGPARSGHRRSPHHSASDPAPTRWR